MTSFRLPDLGEGMEEAEIIAWLVKEGSPIALDEPFVEVQTDKAVVVIPSPISGTVRQLHGSVGDIVKVGAVLVEFDSDDSEATSTALPRPADVAPEPSGSATPSTESPSPPRVAGDGSSPARRAKAAPAVRRLAAELGLNLDLVVGTGPGGRVTEADIRAAAGHRAADPVPAAPPAPRVRAAAADSDSSDERIPLRGVRRRMAQVMSAAWAIPHITGMDEMDASALKAAKASIARAHGDAVPITFLAFFVKAAAQTLREYPLVNAQVDVDAEEIVLHKAVNIGIAVAGPSGLVVPVIRDADQLTLRGLAEEIARLTAAVRDGSPPPHDLSGGTFTITNYGALGRGRFATPIIRPPEVAIVGFGAIVDRPWVVDGEVAVRPILTWSFSADHRIIDGQMSQSFQRDMTARLADPYLMLFD